MPNSSRIQQLLAFLEDDPNDPFLIYALATELQQQDAERALPYFECLLSEYPDYIATYYQAAHFFAELGNEERAKSVFKEGIKRAQEAGEAKTLQELRNAYQNYLFEIED